jgi:hypothetical protein
MKPLRVLIACEHSGIVRDAFRALGHDAWSCDLLPDDKWSSYHIQADIFAHLRTCDRYDLMIAHPPCTKLAISGARWQRTELELSEAVHFAKCLATHPAARSSVVENPVGRLSTLWRKPDQIIQPWMFGHGETKATCLWLRGVPLLLATDLSPLRLDRMHQVGESKDRWKLRSKTFPGIAKAMASQWGTYLATHLHQ